MEYIDLRKVGKEELKQIRSQVVRLKKMGKSGKEIEELVGVRQNRVSEIWTAYQRGRSVIGAEKVGEKTGYPHAAEGQENSGRWDERVNMLSAISIGGNVRFMVYQDATNQQRLIQFIRRLIRTSKRKVFLILRALEKFV